MAIDFLQRKIHICFGFSPEKNFKSSDSILNQKVVQVQFVNNKNNSCPVSVLSDIVSKLFAFINIKNIYYMQFMIHDL